MLNVLPNLVDGVTANVLAYAVLLAAVATITMALLELVKTVTRARLFYHRAAVTAWVRHAYGELLLLTVAEVDSSGALFDQPTDKMMGQIQAAANVAMDFPDVYPRLYDFLTRTPESLAAERAGASRQSANTPDDAHVWREYSRTLDKDRTSDAQLPEGAQAAMRARARLDHFVTRKLDAFQTRTEYMWARSNQFVAVFGCAAFISWLIYASNPNLSVMSAVVLAFFGGMIAPLAKDVVTALSGLRAKAN